MVDELKLFRRIAENLYNQSLIGSGITFEELKEAEKLHGFCLPKVLSEFYLMVGNHEAINYAHNQLISVDFLEIEDNRLIFYSENQGVCHWAIDLADIAEDNPPVWVGVSIADQEELDWRMESRCLSDFLTMMLCWQSVMGGLPFIGFKNDVESHIEKIIKDNFSMIEIGEEYSGLQAFMEKGKLICLSSNKEITVYVGAIDEDSFTDIEDLLQVDWNYSTFDE